MQWGMHEIFRAVSVFTRGVRMGLHDVVGPGAATRRGRAAGTRAASASESEGIASPGPRRGRIVPCASEGGGRGCSEDGGHGSGALGARAAQGCNAGNVDEHHGDLLSTENEE